MNFYVNCSLSEKGSSEEAMLLETYIKLTNEKNSLVGKQEYFNIIENIRFLSLSLEIAYILTCYREVMKEIEKLNKELAEISKSTSDTDGLMLFVVVVYLFV